MIQLKNFDAVALQWDEEPRRVRLAGDIAAAIMDNIPFSKEWDALDFGCGTGLVTLQLAPYLRTITGADSSAGMIGRLNTKIRASGFSNVQAELCDPANGELPVGRYQLITSAMTLHHVADVASLLKSLKGLLHPGGWIALADLDAEDGSFHDDPTGVFHNGFSAEELSGALEKAGFTAIVIKTATNIVKGGRIYPVFLATAQSR